MKRCIPLCLIGLLFLGGAIPASDLLEVDILFTSDVHGHISKDDATFLNPNFPPPLGGGASIAAYVKDVRDKAAKEGRAVLLFDDGDIFQGTPLGTNTKGTAIFEFMNDMGYTACVLGNHDFDLGWENTKRLAEMANFPVLGGNILYAETKKTVDWIDPSFFIEVDGIKIAVVGFITESTANMSFGKNLEGIEFAPIHEVLGPEVERVRAQGANVVLALLHTGLPYKPELSNEYRKMLQRDAEGGLPHWGMSAMELAYTTPGIDAMFTGHTHQGYDTPWEDPRTHTVVFEPYGNGSSIGHITMLIDRNTKQMIGYRTHSDRGSLVTLFEEQIWPDPAMEKVIEEKVSKAEAGLDVVVGQTEVLLQRGSANNALMGFVMADAFRVELNADFAIQNTGGVRADISPGDITERHLLGVSPFGNQMVLVNLKGQMLRGMMEDKLRGTAGGIFISGGKVAYDISRPDGSRIVEFTIGGQPVEDEKIYKVAMTNYLAEGNSGMGVLREALQSEDLMYTGFTDLEVLRNYIKHQGVLNPKNDGRWVKVSPS